MNTETMLTTSQTALRLGVRPQTLRKWRLLGKGPKYIRLGESSGSRVSYRLSEIEDWLGRHSYSSTSEESAKLAHVRSEGFSERCA
jgi:transposase-like protein